MRSRRITAALYLAVRDFLVALAIFAAVLALAAYDVHAEHPASAENPTQDDLAAAMTLRPGDIRSGSLLLRTRDGAALQPAAGLGTDVEIDVTGPVARTTVTQRFRNAGADRTGGVYVFPLPEEATVDTMRVEVGTRVIEGRIWPSDKTPAQPQVIQTPDAGLGAISRNSAKVFTSAVANIGPGEAVTVRIEYQEVLRRDGDAFSLRFPLVVAPRYDSKTPRNLRTVRYARDVGQRQISGGDASPQAAHPNAGGPLSLKVRLDPGFELDDLTSRNHAVSVKRAGNGETFLTLAKDAAPAGKDFVLSWTPKLGAAPQTRLFRRHAGGSDYLLAMITPPAADRIAPAPARDVVFAIDTSGSMSGASLEQAKASLAFALDRMKPGDRFNVVRFAGELEALFETPTEATPENVAHARDFISGLTAAGGTQIMPALDAALADATREDTRLRQVVLLTDGAIQHEAAAFTTIAGKRGRTRLFLVGIGAAPNTQFMRRAAELGRGAFIHIDSARQVRERMQALFMKLERPAVTELHAEWAPGVRVEAWPDPLPDLYAGEPIVIAAQASSAKGDLTLTGRLDGKPWRAVLRLSDAHAGPGVDKLWARRKIAALDARRWSGQDEATIAAGIRTVALEHHLVSEQTSLVAVETGGPRPDGAAVATMLLPMSPRRWDYAAAPGADETRASAPTGLGAVARQLRAGEGLAPRLAALEARKEPAATGALDLDSSPAIPAGSIGSMFSNRLLVVAVMALFFAAMVAATLGFWRHLSREYVSTRRPGRGI